MSTPLPPDHSNSLNGHQGVDQWVFDSREGLVTRGHGVFFRSQRTKLVSVPRFKQVSIFTTTFPLYRLLLLTPGKDRNLIKVDFFGDQVLALTRDPLSPVPHLVGSRPTSRWTSGLRGLLQDSFLPSFLF